MEIRRTIKPAELQSVSISESTDSKDQSTTSGGIADQKSEIGPAITNKMSEVLEMGQEVINQDPASSPQVEQTSDLIQDIESQYDEMEKDIRMAFEKLIREALDENPPDYATAEKLEAKMEKILTELEKQKEDAIGAAAKIDPQRAKEFAELQKQYMDALVEGLEKLFE